MLSLEVFFCSVGLTPLLPTSRFGLLRIMDRQIVCSPYHTEPFYS